MQIILKSYLVVIILAIVFCLFSELIISQKKFGLFNGGTTSDKIFRLLFLNIYIYSLLLITIIFQIIGNKNLEQLTSTLFGNILLFLFLFVLISIIECIGGNISYLYYGRQTWKYEQDMIPFCYGYVSIGTSLYFTFFLFIYIRFIYPVLFS